MALWAALCFVLRWLACVLGAIKSTEGDGGQSAKLAVEFSEREAVYWLHATETAFGCTA